MNVKLVAVIVVSIAALGLLIAPVALAYSDALKGAASGEEKQVKGVALKASPTPVKKITPTPVMKMQVRMATATPVPTTVARHSNVVGVPTTPAGEPMGIGMKNVSATPSRYQSLRPTATARPM